MNKHMQWLFALMMTVCCLPLQAREYKYETAEGDLMKARVYTLDNGLKVYLTVNKEKPRIQTFIAVRTGSKNDPAETTGLAHYLEHLMFKGTPAYGTSDAQAEAPYLDEIENLYEQYRFMKDPEERKAMYHKIDSVSQLAARYNIPNEYDKLMAAIGAQGTNAYTSTDVTCYTEDIPSNEVDNWARIQADRFKHMTIRGFHTELEAVYEEYNIGIARDNNKLWDAMSALLFPKHPYGTQTTIGTQEHLKNPSIVNIKNYFNKWYVPNNVAVCMSGDFDPDEVVAVIDKYFGDWQPGQDVRQPDFGQIAPITAPRDTTVTGLEAETLCMAWRFDRANSLQCDTLWIVGDILNNGTAGLIDLDLTQQMKVQEAWAGCELLHDASTLIMAATPKDGQTLDDVKGLLLEEVGKLKRGDFSDDLLVSIANNDKLKYYRSLENNRQRADKFVDAFINEIPWQQAVGAIGRRAKITKQAVVDFANRYLRDNYVVVYKRQGEDTTLKKIDKPAITAIPANRDKMSQFVKDIQNTQVKPILPQFVDFQKDLAFGKTKGKLPYAYVQNTTDGTFQLVFIYDFGSDADVRYPYAASYIDYLRTDKYSNEEIKQLFYKLACDYSIRVGQRSMSVTLSGLAESMPEALALTEHILSNARPDQDAWNRFVALQEKQRADARLNQQSNFSALYLYGMYGEYNPELNNMTVARLKNTDPKEMTDLLKGLSGYEHTVLYYGPLSEKELSAVVTKGHKTPKHLTAVPEGKHYEIQTTPQNEVLIAPYDAKNIYMRMIHNENKPWSTDDMAVKTVFDEYFGGGMNAVVFQELREARGLAYNAYASYVEPSYKDKPEYFFTHVITQNDKMMDCIRQFNNILDTIPESEAAFRIAKESVAKRLASQRTTRFGLINAWRQAQMLGIDYDVNEKVYNALPGVTLQDIIRFEKANIAGKPYRYVILGNEKELDMESLGKIGNIRRLTTDDIFSK